MLRSQQETSTQGEVFIAIIIIIIIIIIFIIIITNLPSTDQRRRIVM